ncbi:MAG: serine hydrolase domain-containing protein [Gemmatimonadales bacterium]
MRSAPLHGTVAPGFEPVREAFARNFAERGEVGAACAVYRRGVKVVDLWGGFRDRASLTPWEEDTLVLVFSTTKGLSAMAMAVAHSRGLFDLGERVAVYWPEFAQQGKDRITVRQLLAHQAGLCAVDTPLTPALLGDLDALAAALARQRPAWEPGTRHGYHAITLGFYEGELLRRVDPSHRSLGRFFRDEVARLLGVEFHIGLPAEIPESRLATVEMFQPLWLLRGLDRDSWRVLLAMLTPGSLTRRAFANPKVRRPVEFAAPLFRSVEFPAVGGYGVVRDIARAYGAFAAGGAALGLAPATLAALRTPAAAPSLGTRDAVLLVDTRYAFGYLKPSPAFRFGSGDGAFGTMGAGGSFAFADPEAGVGFAYAMNRMGFHVWSDPRERALREAVYRCL